MILGYLIFKVAFFVKKRNVYEDRGLFLFRKNSKTI